MRVLVQGTGITVAAGQSTVLSPSYPTDTAIIFYPGAKVEAEAYLPLLDQIRQTGVTCILVHMPFHMAILMPTRPKRLSVSSRRLNTGIWPGTLWEALGFPVCVAAPGRNRGLILLGAYIYGDYPDEKTLTVYGSLNQSVEDHIDYTEKHSWRSRAATMPSSATMPAKGRFSGNHFGGRTAGTDGGGH